MLHALDTLKKSMLTSFKHSAYHGEQAIHEFPFARLERQAEAISGEVNSQNVATTQSVGVCDNEEKGGEHLIGQLAAGAAGGGS